MKHLTTLSILLALFLAAGVACAGDKPIDVKWSKTVKAEEITFQVLHVMDTLQTLDIKNHKNIKEGTMSESFGCASLLGTDHPSDTQIVAYNLMTGALHYVVTDVLVQNNAPSWVVQGWEMVTISLQANVVHNNYTLGLKMKF